jgi:hypothetical protein
MKLLLRFFFCVLCIPISAIASTTFDKSLELQGLQFHVICPNDSSINELKIEVVGIEGTKSISREVDGFIVDAEIADLNADGFPELYVYAQSMGSGSYGSVIAYASNRNKSLSEIFMPPLDENAKAYKGYMGHDEFAVVEQKLARRFPIYKDGDTNALPTGGTRQIEYKLKGKEAGWVLELDNITDIVAVPVR